MTDSTTVVFRTPTAVAGFVIPVVVDAVDGVFPAGTFAHIGEEVFENQPSFAYGDAACAIPSPLSRPWVEAALLHFGPGIVGWSRAGLMHRSMTVARLGQSFALKASATGAVAARQIVANDNDFDAAIAATGEALILGLGVRESKDDQASETLSGDGGGHV